MAVLNALLSRNRSCLSQYAWKYFYNEYIVKYVLKLLDNEQFSTLNKFWKMYRPRHQYRYGIRRLPPPAVLQMPYGFTGTQVQPFAGNLYPVNYGMAPVQTAPSNPVPVQQPPDVREVIRQDILNQIQPGSSSMACTATTHKPIPINREGRKRHYYDRENPESPKRLKKTHESYKKYDGYNVPVVSKLRKLPNLYRGENGPNSRITQQIIELFIANHQTEEIYRKKVMLRDVLYSIIQGTFPNSGLYITGSSINGFGTKNSDMDLCLMIYRAQVDKSFSRSALSLILKALRKCVFVRDPVLINAKVPILRFKDSVSNIECDINVNNPIGIRNTHLLKYYCLLDWRVRIVMLMVKEWAKFHRINNAQYHTISGYNLTLMLIHYLQICNPPVLPSLQVLYPDMFSMATDISKLRLDHKLTYESTNTDSVGDLFFGFLEYYALYFNFQENAISVRLGHSVPKKQFQTNDNNQNWKNPLCVEEPFELGNAARSCYDKVVFNHVKAVFKTSHRQLVKFRDIAYI